MLIMGNAFWRATAVSLLNFTSNQTVLSFLGASSMGHSVLRGSITFNVNDSGLHVFTFPFARAVSVLCWVDFESWDHLLRISKMGVLLLWFDPTVHLTCTVLPRAYLKIWVDTHCDRLMFVLEFTSRFSQCSVSSLFMSVCSYSTENPLVAECFWQHCPRFWVLQRYGFSLALADIHCLCPPFSECLSHVVQFRVSTRLQCRIHRSVHIWRV